jgi:hypothetical protein
LRREIADPDDVSGGVERHLSRNDHEVAVVDGRYLTIARNDRQGGGGA